MYHFATQCKVNDFKDNLVFDYNLMSNSLAILKLSLLWYIQIVLRHKLLMMFRNFCLDNDLIIVQLK